MHKANWCSSSIQIAYLEHGQKLPNKSTKRGTIWGNQGLNDDTKYLNKGDNVYLVYNRNGNVDRGGDPGENQEIAGSSSKRKGKSARKKKKNLQNELNQVMQ